MAAGETQIKEFERRTRDIDNLQLWFTKLEGTVGAQSEAIHTLNKSVDRIAKSFSLEASYLTTLHGDLEALSELQARDDEAIRELHQWRSDSTEVFEMLGIATDDLGAQVLRNFESLRRLAHYANSKFPLVHPRTGEPFTRTIDPPDTWLERKDPGEKMSMIQPWRRRLTAAGTTEVDMLADGELGQLMLARLNHQRHLIAAIGTRSVDHEDGAKEHLEAVEKAAVDADEEAHLAEMRMAQLESRDHYKDELQYRERREEWRRRHGIGAGPVSKAGGAEKGKGRAPPSFDLVDQMEFMGLSKRDWKD